MSDAIQFLESMGGNARLARMPAGAYEAAIAALDVDDVQQMALLDRDQGALNGLLGGRLSMVFAIMTPDGGESEGEEVPERDRPIRETPEPDEESAD